MHYFSSRNKWIHHFTCFKQKDSLSAAEGKQKFFDRGGKKRWKRLGWLPTMCISTWANRPSIRAWCIIFTSSAWAGSRLYKHNLPHCLHVIIWKQRELSLMTGHKHSPGRLLYACLAGLGAGSPAIQALVFVMEQKPHSQLWRQNLAHTVQVTDSSKAWRRGGQAQLLQ